MSTHDPGIPQPVVEEPAVQDGSARRVAGRKRGVALLLVAILVAAGTIAASELTPSRAAAPPVPVEIVAVESGTAYCPVIGTGSDIAQIEIASVSLVQDSQIVITRYAEGVPEVGEPRSIAAGTSAVLDVPADELGTPVSIDWRGGPVVAQYRLTDDTDQAVANCQSQPSDTWYLSGFDTNRGNTSTLYLFNPFGQDAVVRLGFGTAEGPVDLVIADQINVPAGQVVTRDIADFRPETADLAVTVTAQAGRVIPQGELRRGPAGEGLEAITGRALLPAAVQTTQELYLPDANIDEVTSSWVTVYNPSERAAAVQLEVTTPLEAAVTLSSELTVPPGGTTRIDLAELSALPRLGVRLVSVNGVGLVASRTSAVLDGDRNGLAISQAVDGVDTRWAVVGGRSPDSRLTVFNPSAEVATIAVSIAGESPTDLTGVEVPPNAVVELSFDSFADAQAGPALVTADVGVVAGLVTRSEGSVFWSTLGLPLSALLGEGRAVPAERDPGLLSTPALSATATPAPVPDGDTPAGEGVLDPAAVPSQPTVVPPVTVTPTPFPGIVTPEPAPSEPAPSESAPSESAPSEPAPPEPAPSEPAPPQPTGAAQTEDSLFG